MEWGVSYFGVRNPQHFQRDLDDIARLGFTYIVFTFSEDDHRFYQGAMAECVQRTQQQGLKAYVDPWGVCGIFGGEAFTERGAWDLEGQQWRSDGRALPLLCLNSTEVRVYLRQWITTVAERLHADGIFWDEPHFYLPFGDNRVKGLWGCCCQRCQDLFTATYQQPFPTVETAEVQQCKQDAIVTLLDEVTTAAAAYGLRNIVCLLTEPDSLETLESKYERFVALPHLDVLATDPYPLWHGYDIATTQRFCQALLAVCQRAGKAAQMWIQGFRVQAGAEPLLGEELQLMVRSGMQDIAIWSYLATAYMSSHACADSMRVWEVVTQTMQDAQRSLNGVGTS
jgi:hypothetical protein